MDKAPTEKSAARGWIDRYILWGYPLFHGVGFLSLALVYTLRPG